MTMHLGHAFLRDGILAKVTDVGLCVAVTIVEY